MPYKSDAQRRYMHAKHPEIAARWDAEIRAKKKVAKGAEENWRMGKPLNKQGYTVKDRRSLGRLQSAANRGYRKEAQPKKVLRRVATGAAVGAGAGLVVGGPVGALAGTGPGALGGLGYQLHRGFKGQNQGFRNQLGNEIEGGKISYRKPVKKAFEDHPKVKYQGFGIVHTSPQGQVTAWAPTHTSTHARGKSLVLRRPKYQVVGQPDKKLQKLKGTNRAAFLTRNMRVRHKDAVKFQEAYKKKATSVTLSNGQKLSHEVGKSLSDRNLKRAKKASASLSIAGGTLGLGGLAALMAKKPQTAAKLSIGATGVGGIGSYNYAAIQRAEAKKKNPVRNVYVVRNRKQIKNIKSGLEPVTKGFTMDYGLGDVRQGENVEISKRKYLNRQEEKQVANGAYAGAAAAPTAAYFGSHAAKGGKAGYKLQRSLGTARGASHVAGARTAGSAVRGAADAGKFLATGFNNPLKSYALMLGGAYGGAQATASYLKKKKNIGKAYNPEGRRMRRMENSSTALSAGAGAAGVGAGAYALNSRKNIKAARVSWSKGLGAEKGRQQALADAYEGKYPKGAAGASKANSVWRQAAQVQGGAKHFIEAKQSAAKGLKSAGKAGGLGLAAVGLAVGSDRVRNYSRGRGGSYRQLHRGA